jgi:hypothetical protein
LSVSFVAEGPDWPNAARENVRVAAPPRKVRRKSRRGEGIRLVVNIVTLRKGLK